MYKEFLKLIKFEDCTKSEITISEEEAVEMIKSLIKRQIEKHAKNPISEEELQKGLKHAFKTGLTVLGMIHGAHYIGQPDSVESLKPAQVKVQERNPSSTKPVNKEDDYNLHKKNPGSYKNKKIDSFLQAISMVESSDGKNVNHKRLKNGIHAGDAAVGSYGLMPNTVKNIAGLMDKGHPLRRKYLKMNNEDIEASLSKNPSHQKELASHLATKLHDKFGGDESKMAYSWNQGHNLQPEHFKDSHKDYKNHDYVQKYHKNRSSIEKGSPFQKKQPNPNNITSSQ